MVECRLPHHCEREDEHMQFFNELRIQIEREESRTVGDSFGGTGTTGKFSVPTLRNWVIENLALNGAREIIDAYTTICAYLSGSAKRSFVTSALRFSFLIELTDLKVGSTKMKSRWLPGRILVSQNGSFEPIEGVFEPGNDPRAATFEECAKMFKRFFQLTAEQMRTNPEIAASLNLFVRHTRIPYEFPISYRGFPDANPHNENNMIWCFDENAIWLAKARSILASLEGEEQRVIKNIEKTSPLYSGRRDDVMADMA